MREKYQIHWTGRDSHQNIITTGWTTFQPTENQTLEEKLDQIHQELINEKGIYIHITWTITESQL